jgi:hypothetical protein
MNQHLICLTRLENQFFKDLYSKLENLLILDNLYSGQIYY